MQANLISAVSTPPPARRFHEVRCVRPADPGKGALASWQIRRLTEHIDANLCATLRTTHLAATLGLSVSHFSRAFKSAVGVPARVYVLRRRLAAACEAMLSSDEPLTRIAHAHGFCDQSHFTRAFQTQIGMGPQAWRLSKLLY